MPLPVFILSTDKSSLSSSSDELVCSSLSSEHPVPLMFVECLDAMQLVVKPPVLLLHSMLFVDDCFVMLSVISKVGLIAIRTLVPLQRLSYLLMIPVC